MIIIFDEKHERRDKECRKKRRDKTKERKRQKHIRPVLGQRNET